MLGASWALGAVVFAALVSVSETAKFGKVESFHGHHQEGSHGHHQKGSHGHHHHHQHKKHHKMKHAGHDEKHHASDAGAKTSADDKFGVIQQKLTDTWKSKDRINQLKHELATQKALLAEQKAIVDSTKDSEEVDETEKKQFVETLNMVKDSKDLMRRVRKSAMRKTKQAIAQVKAIDQEADREMAAAELKVKEGEAEVARAKKASAAAALSKTRARKILQAAEREEDYFQKVLHTDKMQDGKNATKQAPSLVQEKNKKKVPRSDKMHDGKNTKKQASYVCGAGYTYSHIGYWDNAVNLSSPFGAVLMSNMTLDNFIPACSQKCDQEPNCVGYDVDADLEQGGPKCFIYNELGNPITLQSNQVPSLACKKTNPTDPCGADYTYSHIGYWDNVVNLSSPFGAVLMTATTQDDLVDKCRQKCDERTNCVGYDIDAGLFKCFIYNELGDPVRLNSTLEPSLACKKVATATMLATVEHAAEAASQSEHAAEAASQSEHAAEKVLHTDKMQDGKNATKQATSLVREKNKKKVLRSDKMHDGKNAKKQASYVCGEGYTFSHNGYWDNVASLQPPFGYVNMTAVTVDKCRQECDQQTQPNCVGYDVDSGLTKCCIYNVLGNVETTTEVSPACSKTATATATTATTVTTTAEVATTTTATATATTAATVTTTAEGCNNPVYDIYLGFPDGNYRRCGTEFGGHDTTSDMCQDATEDGKLHVSASEMESRCNQDDTCAAYGHCSNEGGYYRPVSFVDHSDSEQAWTTYVKYCKACAQDVVVSGAPSNMESYMGVFVRSSIQPTSTQADRPIYRNSAGNFLYYWAASARWQIGDDYNDNTITHLYAVANTHCPEAHASWKLYDTIQQDWVSEHTILVDEACAPSVLVSGAEDAQPDYMGVYVRTNMVPLSVHGNRPIYVNEAGKALYYWVASGRWEFGGEDDYDNDDNVHLYEVHDHSCPSAETSFGVFNGHEWAHDYIVHVQDEAATTTTTQAATASAADSIVAATASAAGSAVEAALTSGSPRRRQVWQATTPDTESDAADVSLLRRQGSSDNDDTELDEEQGDAADEN